MKCIYAATLLLATLAHAEVTTVSILPSASDPAIKTFDNPHWIYVNRDIAVEQKSELPKDRHELLLWLTGTGGKGKTAVGFCNLAADLGYHVVTLMYPDDIPATACANDSNPKSFERFRMSVIQYGSANIHRGRKNVPIERSESIENRLIRLLMHLKPMKPREHWEQFLNDDCTIK